MPDRSKMKKIIIILNSFGCTLLTLLIPIKVDTYDQLKSVSFGFPVKYIKQNMTITPHTEFLPELVRFGSLWDNITIISWSTLIIDMLFFIAIEYLLIFTYKLIKRQTEQRKSA